MKRKHLCKIGLLDMGVNVKFLPSETCVLHFFGGIATFGPLRFRDGRSGLSLKVYAFHDVHTHGQSRSMTP